MQTELAIEQWSLDRVTPYDKNPRKNEGAVEKVAISIKEFGFRQPVVVDEEGVIIAGHTRFKAAKQLGLSEVPVHIAKGLSEAQIKAYRIADNKTNELAEWDLDLLPLELTALEEMEFDI
ncbi:MAG: ParB N-terminal domain-containing protein, partial [Caldilineaceae bacterium]|nr:ParB N-terminal domain-containing protein [Caldilineaceae bacterium]